MSQRAPLTQRRGFNHISGTLSTPLSKRVTEHHSLKENCITTGTWNVVFAADCADDADGPGIRGIGVIGGQNIRAIRAIRGQSIWVTTLRFSNVPLVNLFDSLECVNIGDRLVQANPHDAWKPERVTARMAIALLNTVEGNFYDDTRFNQAEPAVVLNGVLLEELRHFGNFDVCQS